MQYHGLSEGLDNPPPPDFGVSREGVCCVHRRCQEAGCVVFCRERPAEALNCVLVPAAPRRLGFYLAPKIEEEEAGEMQE